MSIARQNLPPDVVVTSFVQSKNGSCGFWNLTSQMLAAEGQSPGVVLEMAHDDADGAPTYNPNNTNTPTFETGANDSTGTC
jgi:hypothetical protein